MRAGALAVFLLLVAPLSGQPDTASFNPADLTPQTVLDMLDKSLRVHGDSAMDDLGLGPEDPHLTGVVLGFHENGALHWSKQFRDGVAEGVWYWFRANGMLSDVEECHPDGGYTSLSYDETGSLTERCEIDTCPEERFNRIFGGDCPGTCWTYDASGRVEHMRSVDQEYDMLEEWYYANGQPLCRKTVRGNDETYEQWCPTGKRVGFLANRTGSDRTGPTGALIAYSPTEQRYYRLQFKKGEIRISRSRRWHGRWMTIHEANNQEKRPKLNIPGVGEPQVHPLPCGFRKR